MFNYCFYIFQSTGVRYYLDGNVKLKPNVVDTLKHSNIQYPSSSEDFDEKFVRQLLRAIFTKSELKKCSSKSSLKELNPPKLKFAKCILIQIIMLCMFRLSEYYLIFSYLCGKSWYWLKENGQLSKICNSNWIFKKLSCFENATENF